MRGIFEYHYIYLGSFISFVKIYIMCVVFGVDLLYNVDVYALNDVLTTVQQTIELTDVLENRTGLVEESYRWVRLLKSD